MTRHQWCWGDIISPELADKALCAEAARAKGRTNRAENAHAAEPKNNACPTG